MKIIKLSAIDSTNSFLKNLAQNSILENFTVVVARQQRNGRGQQENGWASEPNKNLTFSLFLRFENIKIDEKKYLNFAVSLAVYNLLLGKKIPKISIKWPNDILSVNSKICGILIENTFSGNKIKNTIIGIGLNVNQEIFPQFKRKATSLKLETKKEYNLDVLLDELLKEIKKSINLLESKKFDLLDNMYLNALYKKNIPTMFKNSKDKVFMGMISGVSKDGNLQILLEDDTIKEFGIKEISFL
ncbi:biotin--[acetyl-CoA-carboxylase] ligase [Polaribacter sargassicola]|uniref:biotin--[acetyl-CoA-carboxylase] ligase n=1 Tax=Polaribacter sargassicola TaxID=2836891 RepID=UPI001F01B0D2|nr:biotin--[acetyl-CoA-carboxylase] ligase [Polaribacter sp. DS7-9]MCG1035602.1 biotin--[acetyl-CoA-carboxylase] ligase [Polaribacter sp. DS7-9]